MTDTPWAPAPPPEGTPAETSPLPIAPSDAATPPPAPRAKRRRGWIVATAIVTLLALAAGSLATYLWLVHSEYVEQNEQLRVEASDLGRKLAEQRAENETQAATLVAVRDDLAESKEIISNLANDEAQTGDDYQVLVDLTDGLVECADLRQELIDFLQSGRYTASSLRAREADITDYCDELEAGYDDLLAGS